MQVDANGIIQDGPFQGSHIDDLEKYTDDLQKAMAAQGKPPQNPPQQPPPANTPQNPNQTLQNHAQQRVAPLQAVMLGRMEQDDEAEFARSVADYATHKPKIDKIKETLTPDVRVQRGLHRQLYAMVKAQDDPTIRHHLYGEALPPPPPSPEGQTVENEGTPQGEGNKEPVTPPGKTQEDLIKQVTAKPAGPATAPPAGGRHTPPAGSAKVPKLKATDKIEKAARALGKDLNEYLLALEAEGVTQESINAANVRKSDTKRQSKIYGLGS
jgi:hypothetical protein